MTGVIRGMVHCFLCPQEVVTVLMTYPKNQLSYVAFMRLRESPIGEDEIPSLRYGLCGDHSVDLTKSCREVEARILAAAAEVSVQ